MLTATSAFASDPQIASFTDNPDPVAAGGIVTYTARLDNSALDAATNVFVRVPVPTGATFVSATAPCALVGSNVDCTIGTVGGNSSDIRNYDFAFRANGPGPSSITATATLTSDNDINPANNSQSQTTTVTQGANLSLTKTGSPNPVVGGANVTYTLTASNAGPNASASIVVTDNLPPSTAFVSAAGSGWSCSQAAGTVSCTHAGSHPANAAIPALTIVAKVNAASGTITNSASIAPANGGTADPDSSNNTATADTNVLPGADVRIAQKTVTSVTPAVAGQNVSFRIDPRNSGPAAAANAVVTDNLPNGWAFVSAGGPNWACSAAGQAVTCTRASFPTSATDNITVVATAPSNAVVGPTGTVYTNTASVASDTPDPNSGNNSGSVNVTVLPDGADLRISKQKTPNPVAQGSTLTSTIRVTNNGPRVATGPLRVVEQLAGETYASASGSGWSCDASNAPTIVCNHANAGTLTVGASLPDLVILTTATAAGVLTNNACTGSSLPSGAAGTTASPPIEGDPNPGNDCAGASSTSTTTQPDLAIAKTTGTPTGGDKIVSTSESSVTYTLVVSNLTSPGSDAATGIVIRDTVPGYIAGRTTINAVNALVTPSGATFSCAIASAQVTCTQTGGQLVPGQTVTVPITVNRPMQDGSFTNTATVTNTAEGDPNAGNNSASDTVQIDPIADIQVTGKTATPAAIRAGEQSTYVISYRNNGPSPALGVALTDQFSFPAGDNGLTVVSIASSKGGSSCTIAAGAVLAPGADNFSCSLGTLANGEAQTVTLVVRANYQSGNAVRSFGNTASATTTSVENPAGGDNGNNSQSATLTVNPSLVDLLVNKTDYEDPVPFSGNAFINYRVAVTNNGPSFATSVRIAESMTPPAGKRIRYTCDTTGPSSATCNAPSLCSAAAGATSAPGTALASFNCSVPAGNATTGAALGDLANGQTKSIYLRFEVLDAPAPSGDIYNNSATVSANEPDSFAGNDSATEPTTVRQRIDLAVAKTSSLATVNLRQPFTWTVTVTNNGSGNSAQTDLTDTLPAGVSVTGPITWSSTSPVASGSCTLAGSTVSCALGVLNNGGVATVSIPASADTYPSGGTLVNTASVDTDPIKIGGIDPVPGNNTGSNTVGVQRSSLAGTVFEDRDRAGANAGTPQSAASEPRIAGVTLTLAGTDAYGNAVSLTTTSDASGNYSFANLSPADATGYTLTETQPAGYANSPASPPSSGGSAPSEGGTYASGGSAGNSSFSGIALAGNRAGTNYNFPEVRRPSLAGFVYIDQNYNGVRDAGTDIAVGGATVRLLDAGTLAVIATTTTNASGAYSFTGLDPFTTYTLEEPLPATPANLRNGPVNPGLVGGAACASGCTAQPNTPAADTDRIAAIDLGAGADGSGFNFGELQQATVSGLVFVDANRNAALDGGETGRVAGVTVRLVQGADCTAGTTLQTATTAADGSYAFANVLAFQNYLVCETQPAGYGTGSANGTVGSNVIAIANLASGGSANNNFGETLAQLSGSVYQDTGAGTAANFNNGVRDAGELGIANVPVSLTGTDQFGSAVSLATTTDAAGNYSFDGLFPANPSGYTITEGAIPAASGSFLQGRDAAGGAGGNTAVQDVISAVSPTAGQQAGGYLFGELPQAAITGTVYVDRNRDNTMQATPADGRIAGVTLRLVVGADCSSGSTQQTVSSAADGSYGFSAVAAGGNYLVCETQPAGYANGGENPGTNASTPGPNVIAIANLPATGSAGNNFGERVGSLAGSVYQDYSAGTPANTNNGQRDAGELGIANVPVTLSGRDVNNAAVNLTVLTDASGNYAFADLLQSDATGYTLTEGAIPAASGTFADGKETAGTLGGSVAVNDAIGPVVLPAGTQAAGYLFGELPIAPISGTVYLDRNRNGTLDASPTDGRIAGVAVRLVQGASCAAGTTLQATTTAADGSYSFSGASAGANYLLCETQPAGYAEGSVNPGASASTPALNTIAITNLPAAGSANNQFGERAGSIAGTVFLDANDDGLRAGDAGIAGIAVTLSGSDAAGNPVSRSAITDATGAYRFDDVLAAGAGGYTLTEQAAQPVVGGRTTLNGRTAAGTVGGTSTGTASAVATTPSTVGGIALAAGADSIENNFAEILPVALSGTVYIDLNNNGVQNLPGDAGLAGVGLVVTGTDDTGAAVSRSVTTAADGTYALPDLRPGTYTVTEPAQPTGTTNGITSAGTAGGTATPPATLPSAVSAIVLTTPGATGTGYNFGEIPNTSAVSGRVWLDANNNGVIEPGEAGIAGVTVTLAGTDLGGASVARTTTTDASGGYSFASLPPGNYTVTEPTQPASTLNGTTVPGSAGGTATAPATTPSAVYGIVLGVGQTSSANDFGELPTASIGGRVIGDSNNNGRLDAGESGIANVSIVLTGTDDLGRAVNLATTSDAAGAYAFGPLRPGTYTVTEPTQPPGTVNGITTAGTLGGTPSGTATPPATVPSAVSAIVLPPGGASVGNDFAEIGNSPDLLVSKAAVEARFTVNNLGSYAIRVRNGGEVATNASYRVSDRLPAGLTLAGVPTGTGWACTGAIGASGFTCTASDAIAAGAANPNAISVKVRVAAVAATNSPAVNAVMVDGGGELPARAPSQAELDAFHGATANLPACNPAITQNACRTATLVQAAASISGTAWFDTGATRGVLDAGDRRLPNWAVEIVDAGGSIVARTTTAADGSYRIDDLLPSTELHVRFRDPAANVVWGYPVNGEAAPGSSGTACHTAQSIADGSASSCPGGTGDPSLTVVLAAGQKLPQQSLPVDPSGVVYDSGTRQPVPGSVVTLAPVGTCAGWNPATGLVAVNLGGYGVDGSAVSMTVGTDGFYQFLFTPAAPASCTFGLSVAPPATHSFVSVLIPPATGPLVAAGAPGSTIAVQPQAGPPPGAIGPGTTYYLTVVAGSGTANVIHNHIPVDPLAPTGLTLAKTGDRQTVELGDSLRYTITVQRTSGPVPRQLTVVDRLPAGFTYIAGTAVVNGTSIADPMGKPGPVLAFNLGAMPASGQLVLQYRVRVGVGAQQGDAINRATGYGCGVPQGCVGADGRSPLPGAVATNEGRYQVRLSGGVFTTEACFAGKIFVDCNGNHVQDAEEIGIPGVRLIVSDGTTLVSDSEGKYSYCGLPPKSHVLRVDETTLPRGSRLTTSSNRNLGDAGSLWLDLKNGELHRADFVEGSCSAPVIEQVKARRAQGEVRTIENEKPGLPALRFDSKDKGPKPRIDASTPAAGAARSPLPAGSTGSAP